VEMTETVHNGSISVYGRDGNHYELNFSKTDSTEVLRNLLGSVLNIPADNIGGLRDRNEPHKNYTYNPSILPVDAQFDVLTVVQSTPTYIPNFEKN